MSSSTEQGFGGIYRADIWSVPTHQVDVISEKRNRYCVLVFVINEGKRIRHQLSRMKALQADWDVAVADGGSTDSSLDLQFLRSTGVRALLTKTGPGKLSAQMRMGLAWAMDQKYEGVIILDGNGKDDVSAIPTFIGLLEQGYDHIQGSRFIEGGQAINTPLTRLLALKLLHAPLMSFAGRRRMTDTTNGFRGYSAKLILDSEVSVFRDIFVTYELHYHLALESSRNSRFIVTETAVTREYPATGKIPTKISPFRGNVHVLGVLLKAVFGVYRLKNEAAS